MVVKKQTKEKAAPKKLKIEQLDPITTQGTQLEDKVREIIDYINGN